MSDYWRPDTWDYAMDAEREAARDAYAPDDPKHPDWEDTVAEAADLGRKFRKENAPMPGGLPAVVGDPDEITLFTGNPAEKMRQMQETAQILAEPVRQRHVVRIGQSDHVRVEGWTLLGALLGVHPYTVWTQMLLGRPTSGSAGRPGSRSAPAPAK